MKQFLAKAIMVSALNTLIISCSFGQKVIIKDICKARIITREKFSELSILYSNFFVRKRVDSLCVDNSCLVYLTNIAPPKYLSGFIFYLGDNFKIHKGIKIKLNVVDSTTEISPIKRSGIKKMTSILNDTIAFSQFLTCRLINTHKGQELIIWLNNNEIKGGFIIDPFIYFDSSLLENKQRNDVLYKIRHLKQ